jgi:hypothetical protein
MATIVKTGKARRRKVTLEQENELLELYLRGGLEVAGDRAVQYGVCRRYPANIAATRGLSRPRWRAGNRYKDSKVDHSILTRNDPRWERAKAIGVVVA